MNQHHRNHRPIKIDHLQQKPRSHKQKDQILKQWKVKRSDFEWYPMAGEDLADDPEEDIDVEEEEGIG